MTLAWKTKSTTRRGMHAPRSTYQRTTIPPVPRRYTVDPATELHPRPPNIGVNSTPDARRRAPDDQRRDGLTNPSEEERRTWPREEEGRPRQSRPSCSRHSAGGKQQKDMGSSNFQGPGTSSPTKTECGGVQIRTCNCHVRNPVRTASIEEDRQQCAGWWEATTTTIPRRSMATICPSPCRVSLNREGS